MTAALQDLMSIYFSFNIAYPRPVYPVLLFLQHHVFGILISVIFYKLCFYKEAHFLYMYGSMRVTV